MTDLGNMSSGISVRIGNREYWVAAQNGSVRVNGAQIQLDEVRRDSHGAIELSSGERRIRIVVDSGKHEKFVTVRGREYPFEVVNERDQLLARFAIAHGSQRIHSEIKASMPGLVVRIAAEAGSTVVKGQAVLILEAMKMENEIRAMSDGTVRSVHVRPGQAVEKGDLLMVIE